MIGIYKITSPSNRVYIGQSVDIEKRFSKYKKLNCKSQPAIYNSLLKYSFDKHKFEILCECKKHELNDKERYYQDFFNATGKNGLNCRLTISSDKSGKMSDKSRQKMSESRKGIKHSEEHIRKRTESLKGLKRTEESKLKMSKSHKGKNISENTKLKISKLMKGRFFSDEWKLKISESNKGKKMSKDAKINMSEARKKIILNTETGIFYNGIKEAAESININHSTLQNNLIGKIKNKTNLIYV